MTLHRPSVILPSARFSVLGHFWDGKMTTNKQECDYEEERQRNLNWYLMLMVLSCHSKVFMVMSAIDLSWSNGWKLTPKKGIDQNIGASWPKVLRSDWQVISRAENRAKNLQNPSRFWIIWTRPSWAITWNVEFWASREGFSKPGCILCIQASNFSTETDLIAQC